MNGKPLFVTIPHSGEKIPPQVRWLEGLPEEVLMCDVDRFVDRLYAPALAELEIPSVKTDWHRYVADLNRIPEDVDCDSVQGHSNKSGSFSRGFHWVITTYKHRLMPKPITIEEHDFLVNLVYKPFHLQIQEVQEKLRAEGFQQLYHIDAHSMPSVGTAEHRDPGQRRADIVVSDSHGKSASTQFKDLVIAAYEKAGFKVAYNWPYYGGRLTEQYGNPAKGHHTIQVEMNRDLYMNEQNKKIKDNESHEIQTRVKIALSYVLQQLPK